MVTEWDCIYTKHLIIISEDIHAEHLILLIVTSDTLEASAFPLSFSIVFNLYIHIWSFFLTKYLDCGEKQKTLGNKPLETKGGKCSKMRDTDHISWTKTWGWITKLFIVVSMATSFHVAGSKSPSLIKVAELWSGVVTVKHTLFKAELL